MLKRLCILAMVFSGVVFGKAAPEALVLPNGNFEEPVKADGSVPSWTWWQREGFGQITLVDGYEGGKALHVRQLEGSSDFALTNRGFFKVTPGDEYVLSMRVKIDSGGMPSLQVMSFDKDKKRLAWGIGGTAGSRKKGKWLEHFGHVEIPQDCEYVCMRVVGGGKVEYTIDDLKIEPGTKLAMPQLPPKPRVQGWATEAVTEKFSRGVFAQEIAGGAYVSWRLLSTDAAGIGFDVYRHAGGKSVKLNASPIVQTCDYTDKGTIPEDAEYEVRVAGAAAAGMRSIVHRKPDERQDACQIFKVSDPKAKIGKIGVADLNGDGVYDYVVQLTDGNIDPWHKYWHPSKDTYKLEAYLADGTRLWTFDRGWSIEGGIWYSPYVVADVNGDGRAEVILKCGDGDPRNTTGLDYAKDKEYTAQDAIKGMVESGDEWLVVLDGMTGKEIARAPWPSREGFSTYNLYCRNQLAVARLDGKTPCVIALRGTYNLMKAEAWQLKDGKLEALWQYNNEELPIMFLGQGAHTTLVMDIDRDGRDEVLLGSVVLDDNGDPLWTTGKGHPDGVYYGDLLPEHPGMELAYVLETGQAHGGMCYVDALTGKIIWQLKDATKHVHGHGMCADIDCMYPGVEFAGVDADNHKMTDHRWMFTAKGELLFSGEKMPFGFAQDTAYWDGDLQRELCRGRMYDYEGDVCGGAYSGSLQLVADIVGDWREEIITSRPGEFRVYSTSIPAMDRRVCLMEDYAYRMRQMTNAQGYMSIAALQELPSAAAPNLNLTFMPEKKALRVVVTAPLGGSVEGKVDVQAPKGLQLSKNAFTVKLGSEGIHSEMLAVSANDMDYHNLVTASLTLKNGVVLRGQVPVNIKAQSLKNAVIREAEDMSAETGGKVMVREDKKGAQGKSVSHWDNAGHALTYKLTLKDGGRYVVAVRYCSSGGANRNIAVDGRNYGKHYFPGTGGMSASRSDWDFFFMTKDKKKLELELAAGEHSIVLTNADGAPCNLDYVALVKVK